MIKKQLLILIFCTAFLNVFSQKKYSTNSTAIIFAFSDVRINNLDQESNLRFSLLVNYGKQWHHDFNDFIGFYYGAGIRNIGFKYKENNVLNKHRVYSVGTPLALKLGSFKNHFFLYSGGEYEMFFHYKHKQKVSGNKSNYSGWFSPRINIFMPSVFVGMQFPKGLNLRFSYYLIDFLNKDYQGNVFEVPVDYAFWNTQVYYLSLSFNMKKGEYKKILKKKESQYVSL